jgi:hypothetical protein
MKNCMIIACALDNWADADYYTLAAKKKHNKALRDGLRRHDAGSLEALEELREDFQELEGFRDRDLAAWPNAQLEEECDESGDVDEGDEECEHDKTLALTESETGATAQAMGLPIRAAPPEQHELEDGVTSNLHEADVAYLLSMEEYISEAEKARYIETVKRLQALLGNETTALPTSTL